MPATLSAPRTSILLARSSRRLTVARAMGTSQLQRVSCNVAVIGAGAAGLAAIRELAREGHRVTAFELGQQPGGTWRYTPTTDSDLLGQQSERRRVHSSMYRNLRTNLPREVMSYLDFPFLPEAMGGRSRDSRRFCSHEEVLAYLDAFTEHFQLQQYIQYGSLITRMDPLWDSTAAAAATEPALTASASPALSTPAAAVAAAGAGQQQQQGSDQAATAASSSSNRGAPGPRWRLTVEQVQPGAALVAGEPTTTTTTTQEFDAVVVCNGHYSQPNLPEVAGMAEFPGVLMHSHNYRSPEQFAGQRVLVVGAAFSGEDICREVGEEAEAVYLSGRSFKNPVWTAHEGPFGSRRNIWTRGMVTQLHPDGRAEFAWGEEVPAVDTVIFATGYKYAFPFLEHTGLVSTERQHVSPLYQHLFVPECGPRLSFVGLPWRVVPFALCEVQSRYVARLLSGRATLPPVPEMHATIAAFHQQLEAEGVAPEYTHRMAGSIQWEYLDSLVAASGPGLQPVPRWRPAMYASNGANKQVHPESYRDEWEDQEVAALAREELGLVLAAMQQQQQGQEGQQSGGQGQDCGASAGAATTTTAAGPTHAAAVAASS